MDNITGARKRADFLQVLHTTELGKSVYEAKQMTTAQAVGADSREAAEWYALDWQAINDVDDSCLFFNDGLGYPVHRLMRCPFRPVSIRPRLEIGFEDRLQESFIAP